MAQARAPAFERLVAEHRRGVARVCRAVLRDDALVADATQETFLRLWRQCELGAPPAACGAWLRRVALTTALDLARRREVRSRAELERRIAPDQPAPPAQAPDQRASLAELEAELERALPELPEGQRTVFVLRHRGGLSLAEVAETLDLALPTVKTHFARACLRLQEKLARFDTEDEA